MAVLPGSPQTIQGWSAGRKGRAAWRSGAAASVVPELDRPQGCAVDLELKNIRTGVVTRHVEGTAGTRRRGGVYFAEHHGLFPVERARFPLAQPPHDQSA